MSGRVIVGMSGGVDSSLAAALLVEQGYDVLGVYMRNWTQELPGYACPWAADLADAERVAVHLSIDLEVWDYEEQYKRDVVDYLVGEYERGRTPNPDVMCNEKVKFGTFAEAAFARGADYIATGHYARVAPGEAADAPTRLLRAADEHKDQTYFLWRVPHTTFARVLFPIGAVPDKATVRAMAAERGLDVADKPDSTGICFIGDIGLRQFLATQIAPRIGPIVDYESGEVLGSHDGAWQFTLGQRRGLDLGGGPIRRVVATDTDENVVYVSADAHCALLSTRTLALESCRWVSGQAPTAGRYAVRTRHTRALADARLSITSADGQRATLDFGESVQATAPGQAVSIYCGTECLGGGLVA